MPHRTRPLLAAIALAACAGAAPANPLPPAVLFFHVHPWDQGFCDRNPIETCEQIVQYTPETGGMEFDLFLIAIDPYILDAAFDIVWSPAWGDPLVFENCAGGVCEEHPMGNGLRVEWTFDPPLAQEPGTPILLGRIGLMAYGYGEMTLAQGFYTGEYPSEVIGAAGTAGVGECFCYTDCQSLGPACGADFEQPILHLAAHQGETAEGMIAARLRWGPDYEICPVSFATDEESCALSVEYFQGGVRAEVTVAVDTGGLPVGEHSFSLRTESACVDCALVIVDVLEPSGIPEDLPPTASRTWGRVKSDFK